MGSVPQKLSLAVFTDFSLLSRMPSSLRSNLFRQKGPAVLLPSRRKLLLLLVISFPVFGFIIVLISADQQCSLMRSCAVAEEEDLHGLVV